MTKHQQKKIKLEVAGRKTKWAPIWVVLRKHGLGKRIHPSRMTAQRRHWRRTKLRIKSRRMKKQQLG